MASFYTTKSLGRSWAPPPATPYSLPPHHHHHGHHLQSPTRQRIWRYASWPLPCSSPTSMLANAALPPGWAYENSVAYGANARQRRRRWERIVLCAFVMAVMFALGVVKRTEDDVSMRVNSSGTSDGEKEDSDPPITGSQTWRWGSLYEPLKVKMAERLGQRHGWIEHEAEGKELPDGRFVVDGLGTVSWSDFAYITHATDVDYLCASVMLLESLQLLGAKAERVLLHSDEWAPGISSGVDDGTASNEARLLALARDSYGAKLVPVPSIGDKASGLLTKLRAFNQTQYQRVLALDSDATIFQPMDELFLVPASMVGEVAMPRAYHSDLEPAPLSTGLMLLSPSYTAFEHVLHSLAAFPGGVASDMDLLNAIYGSTATVLPHRPYLLSSGEFRREVHDAYMGSRSDAALGDEEAWDPETVLRDARYIHFSDAQVPKPWLLRGAMQEDDAFKPQCKTWRLLTDGQDQELMDCRDRQVWEALYRDFEERREVSPSASSSTSRRRNRGKQPLTHRCDSEFAVYIKQVLGWRVLTCSRY